MKNLLAIKMQFPAAEQLAQQLKYHNLAQIKITKKQLKAEKQQNNSPTRLKECYKLQAILERDRSVIETETQCAGRFILATNVLDDAVLSNDEMISEYKAQQSCERGFGFLKDPLFFTDSIFLKSPERIEALAPARCRRLFKKTASGAGGNGVVFINLYLGAKTAPCSFISIKVRN